MKRNFLEELFRNRFEDLPEYELEVGVFDSSTNRKKKGVTNAEIMFIQENGSPVHNIPSRPVLQMTVDHILKNEISNIQDECIKAYVDSDFDEEAVKKILEQWAIRVESYARDIIYSNDGRLAPNAPSVARRKKGNHPLFDTGQLARSIVCKVIKGE